MKPGSERFRVPMFLKFLVGSLGLAAFLIVGSTYVFREETQLRARGSYLAKSARRLAGYMERVGRGMTGQLEMMANDNDLRKLMGASVIPGAFDAMSPESTIGAAATLIHEQLMSTNGLQPDLFVMFTTTNRLLWKSPQTPIGETDLAELAPVEKIRAGSSFTHSLQVIDNIPYQVSAVPVRLEKDIVGGLMIGVRLERYFVEWSDQTDADPQLRMRPLVSDDGNVIAAAWLPDRRAEVARALAPDKVMRIKVGRDERDVFRMSVTADKPSSGDFDFYREPLAGYTKNHAGAIGDLVMVRSRANIVAGSKTPWTAIAVGIFGSVVIALIMGFWVTRPIKQMVRQSRDLLAGDTDLRQRIVVSSRDETADLAQNINQVFSRVHELATRVQSAALQVGSSSAEISAASREMLTGLRDQTLKVESSTTAVTELSASIQQVAGNAARATEVAEQSSSAVGSAVSRMEQIRSAVGDAAQKMRDLGESSKRIGNIVEVIRQISEQTSMLALNASIEAAHAGEQGRGFAVVADEVSSLARRVGQSAKDIEELIQTVKEQTQAAIQSMDVGTREVQTGSELVTGTLTSLGQLIHVVKDTASAVHEQAVVSDEIARNMDAVRKLAGEAVHGSEESVVQAQRLHELAYELEESVGSFNLDASRALPAGKAAG
ncbi:MAG: HAMP domain-containing protein [Deltaproteobacteria bacterium]|nr:HAMP domain-containing protein [Deltaproteobacteria bacterium]